MRPAAGRLVCLALAASGAAAMALEGPQPPALGADRSALLGAPAGGPLEGAELERLTDELAHELRCPVCQGLSVAASPSDSARDMREEARRLLAQGYSPAQVMSYFEGTYGEFVRLVPRARGLNLLVWLAPGAGLLLGVLLIARYLRRGTHAGAPPDDEAELAAYQERVRREASGAP